MSKIPEGNNLHNKAKRAGTSKISYKRGEVYSVNFGEMDLAEMRKARPALIVQNNIGNLYSPTTIVAAIHEADERKELPVCVFVKKGTAGLTKDSVIDAGHLLTIDKKRLTKKWGEIPPPLQDQVNKAIKISLDLA